MRNRRPAFRHILLFLIFVAGLAWAALPAGLDVRQPIGAYLDGNVPADEAGAMPAVLSLTGAFTDTPAMVPHAGLVPFAINSPLWSDGAQKRRWIGLPFNGDPNDAVLSPRIGFAPTGNWSFPVGTVFVKHFELEVNEQTHEIRRLETRILIRNSNGREHGASYRWRPDNSEADLVVDDMSGDTTEDIVVTRADGSMQTQKWLFPQPHQCVICHNQNAGSVLGPKTRQLNGDYTYAATGRTDNQLHTWSALQMFDQALPDTASYPQFAKLSTVTDATATLQHRVRSYLDANCSQCHQPGGIGAPYFDARFDTPVLNQHLVANAAPGELVRRDTPSSRAYQRDASTTNPMPPLARNVPNQPALALFDAWINMPFDMVSVTQTGTSSIKVKFDRAVDPASAAAAVNYSLNGGITVQSATPGGDPSEVTLALSAPLQGGAAYSVVVNDVLDAAAPNEPVWPNSLLTFQAAPTVPGAPTLTMANPGNAQATLFFSAPASDGGSPITGYAASCDPGAIGATGPGSPLVVGGLTNGVTYSCTVAATNVQGNGPPSAPALNVTPVAPPVLVAVQSRKTHGAAGTFDQPLDTAPDINGAVTVESRVIGAGHAIVFQFDKPVSSVVGATAVDVGGAPIGAASAAIAGSEVTVTLTAVPENRRVTVSITGVDGTVDAAVSVGFLVGDVNNNHAVNSSDISGVKARSGQATDATNFRFDLNASGAVNSSDISAVKARSGMLL